MLNRLYITVVLLLVRLETRILQRGLPDRFGIPLWYRQNNLSLLGLLVISHVALMKQMAYSSRGLFIRGKMWRKCRDRSREQAGYGVGGATKC